MPGSKPGERRGGRQKGTANKRTRAIADKAAAEGLQPLEVMIDAMRYFHGIAVVATDRTAKAEAFGSAASIAKDAAPYMHPRLQAIEHTGKDGGGIQILFSTNYED